jgi:hypothetical protein
MTTPTVEQTPYIWKKGTVVDKEFDYFTTEKYHIKKRKYMTISVSTSVEKKEYFIDFIDDWYRCNHPNVISLIDAWHSTNTNTMGWVTKDYQRLFDKYTNMLHVSYLMRKKWCAQILDAFQYLNKKDNWVVQNIHCNFIYIDSNDNIKIGGLIIFYKNIYNKIPSYIFLSNFIIPKKLLCRLKKIYIWMWACLTIGLLTGSQCYLLKRKKDIMYIVEQGKMPVEIKQIYDYDIRVFLRSCLTTTFIPNMQTVNAIFNKV